jgi:hypothetical protein
MHFRWDAALNGRLRYREWLHAQSVQLEDQPPVPHNEVPSVAHSETPVEPTAPKKKSVKPKQSTVAVARVPKEEASAAPQGPAESAAPALSGAAPVLATGSFDNRVGSRR